MVVLAWHRCWPQCALIVVTMLVEAGVYLVATYFVSRNRPAVPRLEDLINSDSFPSGHTAASVALYGSLAIVVWSLTRKALVARDLPRPRRRRADRRRHVPPVPRDAQRDRRRVRCAAGRGLHRGRYVAVRAGMRSAHERRVERAAPHGLQLEEAV